MSPDASDRATVRARLAGELSTDAALQAFCLDHFPDVAAELTAGMPRTARLNLLLESCTSAEISAALDAWQRRGAVGPAGLPPGLLWMVMGFAVFAGIGAGAATLLRRQQQPMSPPAAAPVPIAAAPLAARSDLGLPKRTLALTSQPPDAVVTSAKTGRTLGRADGNPMELIDDEADLCVSKFGQHSTVLSIPLPQRGSLARHIVLSPRGPGAEKETVDDRICNQLPLR